MLSPVKVTKRAKEKIRAYREQLKNERLRVREKRTSIQSETRRERERALLQIVAFRVSSLQARYVWFSLQCESYPPEGFFSS